MTETENLKVAPLYYLSTESKGSARMTVILDIVKSKLNLEECEIVKAELEKRKEERQICMMKAVSVMEGADPDDLPEYTAVGLGIEHNKFGHGTVTAQKGDCWTVEFLDGVRILDMKTCLLGGLVKSNNPDLDETLRSYHEKKKGIKDARINLLSCRYDIHAIDQRLANIKKRLAAPERKSKSEAEDKDE